MNSDSKIGMKHGIGGWRCAFVFLVFAALLFAAPMGVYGQRHPAPPTGRSGAPIDLTGTWMSLITEEWEYRSITPRKGIYDGESAGQEGSLWNIPINDEAKKVLNAWDPAKDEAAREQCRAYGAAHVMRLPGYVRISWQDDQTLKMELTAGNQTRLFPFAQAQPPAGAPTWQGFSTAKWEYAVTPEGAPRKGNLKVTTTRMRAGYMRKNGVPYSANAQLTEYYHILEQPNGEQFLTLVTEVRDPQYMTQPWVLSSHFKKAPTNTPWTPEPCSAR